MKTISSHTLHSMATGAVLTLLLSSALGACGRTAASRQALLFAPQHVTSGEELSRALVRSSTSVSDEMTRALARLGQK